MNPQLLYLNILLPPNLPHSTYGFTFTHCKPHKCQTTADHAMIAPATTVESPAIEPAHPATGATAPAVHDETAVRRVAKTTHDTAHVRPSTVMKEAELIEAEEAAAAVAHEAATTDTPPAHLTPTATATARAPLPKAHGAPTLCPFPALLTSCPLALVAMSSKRKIRPQIRK